LEIDMTQHAIHWFEIPVANLQRAQAFYETVLAAPMRRETMGPEEMAVFAASPDGGVKGCLHLSSTPVAASSEGTRVYLDAGASIDAALSRVVGAGGRITTPKVALPPGMGFFARIADTEGNVVGLFAMA
jgi:uncharacterized protein